jgi:hypothetical protein
MTLQTSGAVPGLSAAWPLHAGGTAADRSCATRLSLARGAMGAAPCKAPEGGGVGGPRAVRGSCAPPAWAVAPRPVLPEPPAPRDFERPPLRAVGGGKAAGRSAGEAAPAPADQRGLSVSRGAVKALAPGSTSLPALRVTAPRYGPGRGGCTFDWGVRETAADELHNAYLRPAPWASAGIRNQLGAPTVRSPRAPRQAMQERREVRAAALRGPTEDAAERSMCGAAGGVGCGAECVPFPPAMTSPGKGLLPPRNSIATTQPKEQR